MAKRRRFSYRPPFRYREPILPVLGFGLATFGIFLSILLILFWIGSLVSFEINYANRFYPGVYVAGQSLNGLDYKEAEKLLSEKTEEYKKTGVTLSFEGSKGAKELKILPSSAGLSSDIVVDYYSIDDWQGALAAAYEWGRSGNILRIVKEQATLIFFKKYFDLPENVRKETLLSLFENEFDGFFKKISPAQFSYVDKKVVITKEESGETADLDKTINLIEKRVVSLDKNPVYVKAKNESPAVTEKILSSHIDFAENLVQKTTFVFLYKKQKWKITPAELLSWLTVNQKDEISINRTKLDSYLQKTVARSIDNPPINSRFEVRDGKLTEILVGKSGNVVDIEKTAEKIEKIIPEIEKSFVVRQNSFPAAVALAALEIVANFDSKTGIVEIPIETTLIEPKITAKTIDLYNIRELVGRGVTSFKGSSADRKHNIETGVSKLTGALLAPGEEFSAVGGLGRISEADGYRKEYVIKNDRSIKELGGGLCQLATTLFRLALNAGLPVTERQEHSYVVSYYGPGLDATIYGPHPDVRFVNDTGKYLLLQGKVVGNEVIFELYGQKDGRQAEVTEPVIFNRIPAPPTRYISTYELPSDAQKCSETPREGMTTEAVYTVTYPDGNIKKQLFRSVYKPWRRICLVGA